MSILNTMKREDFKPRRRKRRGTTASAVKEKPKHYFHQLPPKEMSNGK